METLDNSVFDEGQARRPRIYMYTEKTWVTDVKYL
jgi:hypothetical protein